MHVVVFSTAAVRFGRREQASGSCAAADLEAALQLLHLLFVAELRWDEGRLETVLSYVEENVRNQDKDPQERLMNLISHVNTQVRCVYNGCCSVLFGCLLGVSVTCWSAVVRARDAAMISDLIFCSFVSCVGVIMWCCAGL